MNIVLCPCKDCEFRHESCHSSCEQYSDWKQQWNNNREQIIKAKNKEMELNDRRNKAIKKMFYSK